MTQSALIEELVKALHKARVYVESNARTFGFDSSLQLISEIDAVLSHASTAQSDGWQPIATAPKDGTKILLYFPDRGGWIILAYWNHDTWTNGDTWESQFTDQKPTHWQSPSPPSKVAASILRTSESDGLRRGQHSQAALDVLAERRRQIEIEGWTADHDDAQHADGDLARAAAAYAISVSAADERLYPIINTLWPWDWSYWKPKDNRRNLVRSAALIIAEIERLDRDSAPSKREGE